MICVPGPVLCSEDETTLVKNLFTGYNKVVRPVNHFSEAVVVTVGLQLIQLISVVREGLQEKEINYLITSGFPPEASSFVFWLFVKKLNRNKVCFVT